LAEQLFLTALTSISQRTQLMTRCLFANRFCFKQLKRHKAFSEAVRAVVLPADLMELGYNKMQSQEIVVCHVKNKIVSRCSIPKLWNKKAEQPI